jgi:GTP pyrophosphokinase
MVQVRAAHPLSADGSIDIEAWVRRLPNKLDERSTERLVLACRLAQVKDRAPSPNNTSWGDEHNSFLTGLEMADILSELSLDEDSLVAAVLYRSVREGKITLEYVRRDFGATVAKLIDGVSRMAAISAKPSTSIDGQLGKNQTENVRKMLVAMVDDVRVALIKLAERTCAIRAVKSNSDRREKVAKEVFEIYAPLAHRLGIGHIKWELEDLGFRYLQPDAYKRIANLLDERRLDRQRFIDEVIGTLRTELDNAHIKGEVFGRAKHIYSIWRKMQRKKIGFSQVYDIRAVRVLVPEIKDCYTVLGIAHTLWRNIPNEFDDYIAIPKENGYRSLHTAVIGPEGKVLEVQIRSYDMHEEAEFGVCSHWRYKGTDRDSRSRGYEDKIAWLRQVLDWHEETGGVDGIAEQISADIHEDRIYVFTPDGHVVELSRGATPLDFAYHIHTEVGHRCRGAKVNGRIVPLTYQLQTGEQVEVITGKESAPSRDWLQSGLGYLNTSRARAKLRHYFKQQDREQHIAAGRSVLEKEFKRLALTSLDYKAVAERVGSATVEDMYAAVGAGDLGSGQVLNAAQALVDVTEQHQYELVPAWLAPDKEIRPGKNEITIHGVGNLMTTIAKCCKPLPGDSIVGYITVGRGASIHRSDCSQLLQLAEQEPERIIEVSWGTRQEKVYPVDILIEAYDRAGLLRDITTLLAIERINVTAVNTLSDKTNHTATMRLTVETTGLLALSQLFAKFNRLPNVISVNRVTDREQQ